MNTTIWKICRTSGEFLRRDYSSVKQGCTGTADYAEEARFETKEEAMSALASHRAEFSKYNGTLGQYTVVTEYVLLNEEVDEDGSEWPGDDYIECFGPMQIDVRDNNTYEVVFSAETFEEALQWYRDHELDKNEDGDPLYDLEIVGFGSLF